MAKYRVGLIGCGGISKAHCNGWKGVESVEIVAGADPDEVNRNARCDEYDIPARYADAEEMLEKEALDIVSICTWTGLHPEQTVMAARHGVKGILCEKPMATSLGGAQKMIEACEEAGVKLAIAHQRRYGPEFLEASRLVSEGAIGTPIVFYWCIGSGLLNIGSHTVDTIRMLMNDEEVVWVIGQCGRKTDRHERGVKIEDFIEFIFTFKGGARGVVECDLPEPEPPMKGLVAVGTEGTLTYDRVFKLRSARDGREREIKPEGKNMHVAQAEALVEWMEGGPEHNCSGRVNIKTLEVLMAAYESARIRDVVVLPFECKESPLEKMIEDGTLPVTQPGMYDIRAKDWQSRVKG